MTMAAHGLHPALDLRLVGRLAPDVLQAAAKGFPGNDGIAFHQGIVLGNPERRYRVTDAAVHDSQVIEELLAPDNTASGVWANSA